MKKMFIAIQEWFSKIWNKGWFTISELKNIKSFLCSHTKNAQLVTSICDDILSVDTDEDGWISGKELLSAIKARKVDK
jgi:hypothetical protein